MSERIRFDEVEKKDNNWEDLNGTIIPEVKSREVEEKQKDKEETGEDETNKARP